MSRRYAPRRAGFVLQPLEDELAAVCPTDARLGHGEERLDPQFVDLVGKQAVDGIGDGHLEFTGAQHADRDGAGDGQQRTGEEPRLASASAAIEDFVPG